MKDRALAVLVVVLILFLIALAIFAALLPEPPLKPSQNFGAPVNEIRVFLVKIPTIDNTAPTSGTP